MRRTTQAKQQSRILSVVLILPALALCLLFVFTQSSRPRGGKALETALAALEKQQDYSLLIVEKAPSYELIFQGRVEKGNRLKGTLPSYDLEVLSQGDKLKLRPDDTSEWAEPEIMDLQGLSGFLIIPPQLLRSLADYFSQAYAGETITLGKSTCRTIYFEVPNPEKIAGRLFPEIDYTAISKMIVAAALAEPDLTLKQMRILIEFTDDSREQIERNYHLDY